MLPKARLKLMVNVIEMYSNAILYDDTIDSIRLEKYSTHLRNIKERHALNETAVKIEKEKMNQLNLF